ncbi:MAG: zinc-finger domain-containing protein [Pseudomonadota bacterium]
MTVKPDFNFPEVILVEERKVACDGGGGALGHPKTWYEMGDDDMVECKYCDRRFILKGGRADLHP